MFLKEALPQKNWKLYYTILYLFIIAQLRKMSFGSFFFGLVVMIIPFIWRHRSPIHFPPFQRPRRLKRPVSTISPNIAGYIDIS